MLLKAIRLRSRRGANSQMPGSFIRYTPGGAACRQLPLRKEQARPQDRSTGQMKNGRYWTRTSGPHYVKVVRYQLRQPPVPLHSSASSICQANPGLDSLLPNPDQDRKENKAAPRFELGNRGFADLCLTTWLCRPTMLYAAGLNRRRCRRGCQRKVNAQRSLARGS